MSLVVNTASTATACGISPPAMSIHTFYFIYIEVPYAGRCEPTDTCAGKDMTCRNGNCVCAKGYTGAYRCHGESLEYVKLYTYQVNLSYFSEYTQIHRIITIEVILFYGSLCTRSILRILHRALWFL